jgi:HAD superfamily hydrolase (TIGR01662 family)
MPPEESSGIFDELEMSLGLGLLRLTTERRLSDIDAVAVIRSALNLGVRVLDTANVYCRGEDDLHYGEHLIRQALRNWSGPKDELRIFTKAGLARPGGKWLPSGRPASLRSAVEGSLQALGVEQLFLLQLHARDPGVPFEETLAALAELQQEGKVEHLGLCNVTAAEIAQAQRHFEIASVQNELSVLNRKSATDGTLAFCEANGIPFLAARPLAGADRTARLAEDPILTGLGQRHGATAHELALAALIAAGAIPLVGATRAASVRSAVKAWDIELDESDLMALSMRHSFEPTAGAVAAAAMSSGGANAVGLASSGGVAVLKADVGPGAEPEVVLLMGIQGAGKSELVESYVEAGYARLNRDSLGGSLDDLVPRLEQFLAAGQTRVVLDNTYSTRTSRASAIALANAYGVPARCRHLTTSTNDAHINIVSRMLIRYGVPIGPDEMKMFRKADPNLPPPIALQKYSASFEAPNLDEGFAAVDEIPFVRRVDPAYTEKGLLLDVDGTLRRTVSGEFYPRDPHDLEILPDRTEVLSRWVEAGYKLFFLSNQSGIAAGRVAHDAVQSAMLRTAELLGVPITEIVYCPHPSKPVGCFCRKPMPGLGVYLMQRHQLSREHLVMVGDMDSDAECAAAIGATYFDAEEFFSSNGPTAALAD